jgi:hypothetical protein
MQISGSSEMTMQCGIFPVRSAIAALPNAQGYIMRGGGGHTPCFQTLTGAPRGHGRE